MKNLLKSAFVGAALLASGSVFASNMGFKLVLPVSTASGNFGNNWVSVPYFNNFTVAQDICVDIGASATAVQRYNFATDTLTNHPCGGGINNFAVVAGSAYIVKVNANGNWTIVGSHDNSLAITLQPASGNFGNNWTSIPYHTTAAVAQDICTQVGASATAVQRYNFATDTLTNHPCGGGINNFAVSIGSAYIIKVNASTPWTPAHY